MSLKGEGKVEIGLEAWRDLPDEFLFRETC